jgi:hypothetical protein
MEALMDERVDALLEDVTDALKEVISSIDSLIQSGDEEEGDVKKRLEKNNSKIHEVLSLIGYLFQFIKIIYEIRKFNTTKIVHKEV